MQNSRVASGHEIWAFVAHNVEKNGRNLNQPQKWVSHCILTEALNAGWRWNGNFIPNLVRCPHFSAHDLWSLKFLAVCVVVLLILNFNLRK